MNTAAIVLAGGSGSRVQRSVNKVYLPLGERPMLAYSLETFAAAEAVDRVVVVIREEDRRQAEGVLAEVGITKPTLVVEGGPSRHASERAGLQAIAPEIEAGEVGLVAIHDGARPFVTLDLLARLLEAAARVGGAVPGLAVEGPLYRVAGEEVAVLAQGELRRMQTPQVFWAAPLLAAYGAAGEAGFEGVDTAETVEQFGSLAIEVVPGDPRNLKATFIEDIFQAEEWATAWNKGAWLGH